MLALVGTPTAHGRALHAEAARLGLDEDARFLGTVSTDELEGLYRAAACLVLASRYEGFGLPVLEAMARGVPVACSDRGSLPEVAGDAALLFDPEDSGAVADAIESILGDEALAERLRAAGRRRAGEFSWAAAARGTLASYERAMNRGASSLS